MATTVNRQVNIYIQSGEAEKAFDRLVKKEKELQAELKKATDPKEIGRLKTELDKLQEPLDRAGKKVRGELQPSFRDLKNTVDALGRRLKQMSESDADFSKVLVQYNAANTALAEMKNKISNVNKETKEGGLDNFFGPFLANAAARIIDKLKEMAVMFFKLALEQEGVKRAFDRLNSPGLLDNLRQATKGTVSDLELMKRAVAANNFQIPIERLGSLLAFAQQRARDTGQSVDYLVDSIVTGIARKSPLILDNLGINIQRVNEQFKKTGDFAQAAFNVVDEEAEKTGFAFDTMSDKVDRMGATFKNFGTDVMSGWFSIAENIGDAWSETLGGVEGKASVAAKKAMQEVAQEAEDRRNTELRYIQSFQKQYAAADLEGRNKIIEQVKYEIKSIDTQQAFADFESRTRLSEILGEKLALWKNYYKSLTGTANDGDTLANLKKEIQLTTEIMENAIIGSDQYDQASKKLKELQDRLDKLLGRGKSGGRNPEDLTAQLREQLQMMAKELDVFNMAQVDKDLVANEKKYKAVEKQLRDALKKRQISEDTFGELILMNTDTRERERTLIITRWAQEANKKRLEDEKKNQDKLREIDEKRLAAAAAFTEKLAKFAAESADRTLNSIKYKQEVDLLVAHGKERLRIRLQQLELERLQEIANAEKTGVDVADINRKYDQLSSNEKLEGIKSRIYEITEYLSSITNTIGQVGALQTQNENTGLEDDRRANERKKENYRRLLDSKSISQKEYDKKIRDLDRQQEEREKQIRIRQFNRDKNLALANAAINIAEQITKVLADPFRLALVSILGAVQLGLIAGQKPPKYGKGGYLKGPLHGEGGMPVINPRTGRKEAEVEGGEVILSRATVRNNAVLVDQLLKSSMHKGGASIKPSWRGSTLSSIDISGINKSMHSLKMFAAGGVFEPSTQAAAQNNDEVMVALVGTINRLSAQLDSGITAYTSLQDIGRQQRRLDTIVQDATMK